MFRSIGRFITRHIVAPDPDLQPSRLDREDGVLPTDVLPRRTPGATLDATDVAAKVSEYMAAQVTPRRFCDDRLDDPRIVGKFFVCTLTPGHVGPHECHKAGHTDSLAVWFETDDSTDTARRDEWLKLIGATDPGTPIYAEALADWETAREVMAAWDAARDADALIAEVEAVLAKEAAK